MKQRDELAETELKKLLKGSLLLPRGFEVYCFESTESTNKDAKSFAKDARADCVFLAKRQTAGRGRLGRRFSSEGGGLYMSLLLKREMRPEDALKITVFAAVAVRAAVKKLTGLDAKIKWVNDIFLEKKKLAGILCEGACDEFGNITHAVLGIGLNISQSFDAELSEIATSLSDHTKEPPDALRLAGEIIKEIYGRQKISFEEVLSEYREGSCIIGKDVRIIKPKEEYSARVLGIDFDGALILLRNGGRRERLMSGEVSVRI